jgi:hypothetical protein
MTDKENKYDIKGAFTSLNYLKRPYIYKVRDEFLALFEMRSYDKGTIWHGKIGLTYAIDNVANDDKYYMVQMIGIIPGETHQRYFDDYANADRLFLESITHTLKLHTEFPIHSKLIYKGRPLNG